MTQINQTNSKKNYMQFPKITHVFCFFSNFHHVNDGLLCATKRRHRPCRRLSQKISIIFIQVILTKINNLVSQQMEHHSQEPFRMTIESFHQWTKKLFSFSVSDSNCHFNSWIVFSFNLIILSYLMEKKERNIDIAGMATIIRNSFYCINIHFMTFTS